MRTRLFSIVIALGSLIAVTATLLAIGGYPVLPGLEALWAGSFGSWYALTSSTLVRAIPLMLAGGAVAFAFKAGVLNIGAEGQLLMGATGAMAVALVFPRSGPLITALGLLAAALAGAAWASIAAVLRQFFGVLEVISTIMLNFVALHFVSYLVRGPLQEPTHAYPQTIPIALAEHLPRVPGAGRLHAGLIIALGVLLLVGIVLRWTAVGFRITAVGESPRAAAMSGMINPQRVSFAALVWSGAFAGLAGGIEVFGVTYALYEDISPGYGYTAIAVALLAGLDPWRVILAAIGFAGLEAGSGAMQRDAGVPSTLATIIEALVILVVIAVRNRTFLSRMRSVVAVPRTPA